ncbi:hypothetical protein MRB53_036929 [Persea americana]|nr:hypothetical protein MRB53_036929 [Persea americana]
MYSTTIPSSRATFYSAAPRANKIALEEAISTTVFDATNTLPPTAIAAELPYVEPAYGKDVHKRLEDIDARVLAMDKAGIRLTVLSLTMPGIEGIFDPQVAADLAPKVNDEMYNLYAKGDHAERFRLLGSVAMQKPEAAAEEAERCIRSLGFVGILINAFSNIGPDKVQYLDEEVCEPFWAKMETLDAHAWGFGAETAVHVIRLIVSGLFDRHPRLKIIIGHCGEGIPFSLGRIDHRIRHFKPSNYKCKLTLQEYWHQNFWVSTAGVMSNATFADALRSTGVDRIMWSADYPYEDYGEMGGWFDALELNPVMRAKVGWENARKLLKIT